MTKEDEAKTIQKLVWRLKTTPTVGEVNDLLANGIIDKDEAREILFKFEKEEEADPLTLSRLEKELDFLRGLVLKVMSEGTTTNTIIKYIERPEWVPYRFDWIRPYMQMTNNLRELPSGTIFSMSSIASGAQVPTTIGGMSVDNGLGLNYVSDETGDKINAVHPDTAGFAGTSKKTSRYVG